MNRTCKRKLEAHNQRSRERYAAGEGNKARRVARRRATAASLDAAEAAAAAAAAAGAAAGLAGAHGGAAAAAGAPGVLMAHDAADMTAVQLQLLRSLQAARRALRCVALRCHAMRVARRLGWDSRRWATCCTALRTRAAACARRHAR